MESDVQINNKLLGLITVELVGVSSIGVALIFSVLLGNGITQTFLLLGTFLVTIGSIWDSKIIDSENTDVSEKTPEAPTKKTDDPSPPTEVSDKGNSPSLPDREVK